MSDVLCSGLELFRKCGSMPCSIKRCIESRLFVIIFSCKLNRPHSFTKSIIFTSTSNRVCSNINHIWSQNHLSPDLDQLDHLNHEISSEDDTIRDPHAQSNLHQICQCWICWTHDNITDKTSYSVIGQMYLGWLLEPVFGFFDVEVCMLFCTYIC